MKFTKSITSLFLILALVMVGCKNKPASQFEKKINSEYTIHYAKGFKVKKYADFTEVSIVNPWDTTKLLQNYILVKKGENLPANLPEGTIVRVPLESVVAYNVLQCSTLKELSSADIIKGVCESQYMKTPEIKEGVASGTILDVGMAASPDVEKIINLSPDALLASPINGQSYGPIVKTNIPIIEIVEYTELDPLGRAEWIRFYSLFIGKEALADSLFNITVEKYNDIKNKIVNGSVRPSVFLDMRYAGNWNMSGGKSNMGRMLTDAGGNYLWGNDGVSTFTPLSFETVLDKANDADLWFIRYYAPQDYTYESLEKEYKGYSYFEPFKKKKIYGCNTAFSTFHEDIAIHPEYILKDFAKIFHPDLFPDYELKYYLKMK